MTTTSGGSSKKFQELHEVPGVLLEPPLTTTTNFGHFDQKEFDDNPDARQNIMSEEVAGLEILDEQCFLREEDGDGRPINYGLIGIVHIEQDDRTPPTNNDAEQVSAASNLLEFHNQQVLVPVQIMSDNAMVGSMKEVKVLSVEDLYTVSSQPNSVEATEILNSATNPIRPAILNGYGKKTTSFTSITPVKQKMNEIASKQRVPTTSTTLPLVPKKKRRLLIDSMKAIPNSEFKQQLQDTSDVVGKVDLAPATKKAMHQLAFGGVGKFFAYPGRKILSGPLAQIFFSHLTVRTQTPTVNYGELEPLNSELRTPTNTMQSFSCVLNTDDYSHFPPAYSETLAKRTANSFDQFIKGFSTNKSKRLRIVRECRESKKKQQIVNEQIRVDNAREVIMIKDEYEEVTEMNLNQSESVGDEELITSDPLDIGNTQFAIVQRVPEELSENENAVFYINGNNEQDGQGVQSKIEMLLAAAEQGGSGHGISQLQVSGECGELQLQCTTEEGEVDPKQILFCTAESEEDGSFVIVDAKNGKRYRFVSSHSSGLTLWPQSAKAID